MSPDTLTPVVALATTGLPRKGHVPAIVGIAFTMVRPYAQWPGGTPVLHYIRQDAKVLASAEARQAQAFHGITADVINLRGISERDACDTLAEWLDRATLRRRAGGADCRSLAGIQHALHQSNLRGLVPWVQRRGRRLSAVTTCQGAASWRKPLMCWAAMACCCGGRTANTGTPNLPTWGDGRDERDTRFLRSRQESQWDHRTRCGSPLPLRWLSAQSARPL